MMDVKAMVENGVNMNIKSMWSASKRCEWRIVEQLRRVTDSLIAAYERQIGAIRI